MTGASSYGEAWIGGQAGSPPSGGSGSGGDFGDDPFQAGYEAAARRLSDYDLEPIVDEAALFVAHEIQEVLSTRKLDLPPRGIELFVELVFLGAAARVNYGDERLSQEDIDQFLMHLMWIENSWFHSPP